MSSESKHCFILTDLQRDSPESGHDPTILRSAVQPNDCCRISGKQCASSACGVKSATLVIRYNVSIVMPSWSHMIDEDRWEKTERESKVVVP